MLKKIFVLAVATSMVFGAYAQTESTQVEKKDPDAWRQVTILTNKKGNKWSGVFVSGLTLGWSQPVNQKPEHLGTAFFRSFEIGIPIVGGVRWTKGHNQVDMGLGILWHSFATSSMDAFAKLPDGTLGRLPYSTISELEGTDFSKRNSSLNFFSLQVPVLYTVQFGNQNRFKYSVGPILNFNTGGNITNKFHHNDKEYTIREKSIGQRVVTVDLMTKFTYRGLGLYFRYSPMNIFKDNMGIELPSWSAGLVIDVW